MKHYVCTGGCGGVSDTPKVCDAEDCPKEGEALNPCDCEDGQHDTVSSDTTEGGELNLDGDE